MLVLASLLALASGCGWTQPGDLMGGDIEPLGAGFRNATSAEECCALCAEAAAAGCRFFSFAPTHGGGGMGGVPPHNCWLKSGSGKPEHNALRVCGGVNGTSPPAPGPGPSPAPTAPCAGNGTARPWCNTSLPVAARVAAALAEMTVEEKASQVATFTPGINPGVPRIGWPEYGYHSEGLHGLRRSQSAAGLDATIFPQTTGVAATGNLSLIAAMGSVMATEARAVNSEMLRQGKGPFGIGGSLFFWSPTMNVGRDPRWGRFQESISEDPWLLGAYSSTFLSTFQQADAAGYPATIASCKHFLAYSLEGSDGKTRHTFNAVVSMQDLQETYLPPFHQCVTKGKPGQVMCSYNELNGKPTCASKEWLVDTLRDLWQWKDGFVVSDQGAIADIWGGHHYTSNATEGVAAAISAGCDVNDGTPYATALPDAVAAGLVNKSRLDEAAARFLTQRFRVGSFDPPSRVPWTAVPASACNSAAHQAVALDAAQQAIVLLNNSAGVLPLRLRAKTTLAVVGPFGNCTQCLAGGKPDYQNGGYVPYVAGLSAHPLVSKLGVAVEYEPGSAVQGGKPDPASVQAAVRLATRADVSVVMLSVGIDGTVEHEGTDRTSIGLPQAQLDLAQAVLDAVGGTKPVVAVLTNGGPLSCTLLRDRVPTVVEAFEGGQFAGTALATVLLGDVSPSGVLPFSVFPEGYVDVVSMTDMSMRAGGVGRTYRYYNSSTPLGPPLYPFGYGLSYTTFAVEWSSAPPRVVCADCPRPGRGGAAVVEASARVTNTGAVAGSKVVMAFVAEATPRSVMHGESDCGGVPCDALAPHKSLYGVQKVHLAPGESKVVTFSTEVVPADHTGWCAFCTVTHNGTRVVAPATYTVSVGGDGSVGPGKKRADEVFARVDVVAAAPVEVPLVRL